MKRSIIRVIVALGLICGTVFSAFAEDELKPNIDFKGSRFSAGYLNSGKNGSYPYGSFQMPDVKLRFNWVMTQDITISTRMKLDNATFNSLDCFFIDYKNLAAMAVPSLKDSAFNPVIRLGRLKVDFGEEQLSNDPINGVLISNSAANVAGYDEGLQLSQSLSKDKLGIPFKWSLSLTNGNTTTGADNNQAKALDVKLGALPIPELYVSGSYYDTGNLGVSTGHLAPANAEVTYAGLAAAPTNATEWSRTITEIDVRYDLQPGKEDRLNPGPPAFSDSKAFFRGAYGTFDDSGKDKMVPIKKVTANKGTYYFVEGCYNATEKLYLGVRYSFISLDKSTTFIALNSITGNNFTGNKYTRISVGPGYRLSANTHIKAEYMSNVEDVPTGVKKPKIDQYAILFTTLF